MGTVLIFDGDDTLWETEFLYDQARAEAGRIAASVGISSKQFDALQREIDVRNVNELQLTSSRFPTSSVEAYEQLAVGAGMKPTADIRRRIYDASASVFDAKAPLKPFARAVLDTLRREYRFGLLTKGDELVQVKRIRDSGLREYFQHISIVPEKGSAAFEDLLRVFQSDPTRAWSVGNSLRSDIAPALAIGMRAIWIDTYVWVHERVSSEDTPSDPHLFRATNLAEVPAVVRSGKCAH